MSESNLDKKLRGDSSKESLHFVLNIAKQQGYIKSVIADYSIGKPGYKDKNQFKQTYGNVKLIDIVKKVNDSNLGFFEKYGVE